MKNTFKIIPVMVVIGSLVLAGCSSVAGESVLPSAAPAVTAEDNDSANPAETPQDENASGEEQDEASAAVDAGKEDPSDTTAEDTEDKTGTDENTAASDEDIEKAIEAYASAIKEKAADEQYPFMSFTLIHLDDDDIPELAIAFGGSHADGVGFFGFDGSAVNEIGFTGSMGKAFYEKGGGTAFGWYTGQGETIYNICIIKDGKLAEKIMPGIAIIYDDNWNETGYKYFAEETGGEGFEPKDISAEEFDQMLSPYTPEKRQYRELEYDNLHDVNKTSDIAQTLRDSLAEEDNLPEPDMEAYNMNIITAK